LPYEFSKLTIAKSGVGARGAIGAIDELQDSLRSKYGENVPEKLKSFLSVKPEELAKMFGMYRPGEIEESVALPRGTTFLAQENGDILLETPDGETVNLKNPEKELSFRFFDSGARATENIDSSITQDQITSSDIERPLVTENNTYPDSAREPAVSMNPSREPIDFEKVKEMANDLGYRHESVEGGDIFSKEITSGADSTPKVVQGYANIDGMKIGTPELSGTIDFLYDRSGNIRSLDLSAIKAEDVARFRTNPKMFLAGNHSDAEQAELLKKLMTVRSDVESYLKYRRVMEMPELNKGSAEYRFLDQESNKLWSSIQKKVDYQFNPEYTDYKPNNLANSAPWFPVEEKQAPALENIDTSNSKEPVPQIRNLEDGNIDSDSRGEEIATESDLDKEKTLIEAERLKIEKGATFDVGSKTYKEAVKKFGEPIKIEGNVITFKDGRIGFWGESRDLETAIRKSKSLVDPSLLPEAKPIAFQKGGVYRVMHVFKKP
jgi:hypothetical protein